MRLISIEHLSKISAKAALAAALTMTGAIANAAVTYVDASLANTSIANGDPDDTLWVTGNDGSTGGTIAEGAAVLNDGKWRFRPTIESGIFEATSSNTTTEDAVEIVTTATGLANGLYNAYIFFYPVDNSNDVGEPQFPIRAGFTSNPNANTLFDLWGEDDGAIAGQAASLLSFVVSPPPGSGTRTLLYGLIGQTAVSGGSLSVYVDDWPANRTTVTASNQRTWYAGIGYELVPVPEPGTAGLAVLCATMCLIATRRARRMK